MRRTLMDRKIVELLIGGAGVNSISRSLHVSKRRVRRLREQAKEYGYLTEQGRKGSVEVAPYPEAVFPEPVDGRSLRISEAHELLEPHRSWMEERLSPTSRIRGVKARKWLKNQPEGIEGLHYRAMAEVAWAGLILGGGCAGSSSLSLSTSNWSSGSGWV